MTGLIASFNVSLWPLLRLLPLALPLLLSWEDDDVSAAPYDNAYDDVEIGGRPNTSSRCAATVSSAFWNIAFWRFDLLPLLLSFLCACAIAQYVANDEHFCRAEFILLFIFRFVF